MTRYQDRFITNENRKWWTLAAMCFALFMIMLDNTVVNVALPSIQTDLHASISSLEWTVNAYTLSFAVLLATGGRLGDIFGRRRMFLCGVVVFAISSATAGLAPSAAFLVGSRVAQGVGAAFMMPGTLSIIADAFPAHERGKAIGTWAGVSALALAVGPVVGGLLTEHVSWRAIFYLNLPVAGAAVAATIFAVRESRDETVGREIDYAGFAVLTAGLTALVLALVEGNGWGWGSAGIWALLVSASVLLGAWVAIERRVRVPMVQFSFFTSRTFVASTLVAFVVSFAMLGMFFFMALYMQNILGFSPLEAGVRFLPSTLMIVILAPIAGRLTDRIGPRWPITAGLAAVSFALYRLTQLTPQSTYSYILPTFMIMGSGIALVMSPMSTAAMNAVSRSKAGIASGLLSMSRMIGGTFGVAAIGALFQAAAGSKLDDLLAGSGVTADERGRIVRSLGGSQLEGALRGLDPQQAREAAGAAREAFVHALAQSMRLSAAITLAGAVAAFALIESRRGVAAPEAGAEAAVAVPAAREDVAPRTEAVGDPAR